MSSHSWLLGAGGEQHEPLNRITGQTTFGGVVVASFIIVSGFLIAASWERRKDVGQVLKMRVLRIYPRVIVANLSGAFLLGPMVVGPPFRTSVYRDYSLHGEPDAVVLSTAGHPVCTKSSASRELARLIVWQ